MIDSEKAAAQQQGRYSSNLSIWLIYAMELRPCGVRIDGDWEGSLIADMHHVSMLNQLSKLISVVWRVVPSGQQSFRHADFVMCMPVYSVPPEIRQCRDPGSTQKSRSYAHKR